MRQEDKDEEVQGMPDNWQYPIWNEGVYDPDFGKEFGANGWHQ